MSRRIKCKRSKCRKKSRKFGKFDLYSLFRKPQSGQPRCRNGKIERYRESDKSWYITQARCE